MSAPVLETARTRRDVARLDGTRGIAVGRYRAIEQPVRGIRTTSGPKDRAVLDLEDGTTVYLEPLDSPRSSRPSDELQRFDGRSVQVRGVLYARMPSEGQSLIAPCIAAIEDVAEAVTP